jgi:dihydrofolate synthase/folylpolyglutamate synthase
VTASAERLDEVYREILDRTPEHDLVPSLDRIAAVCHLLGDPQRAFRVVHLTGTNGKTSTTRMVERLLREHSLRTGRFTSPHLSDVRERICLDGEPIAAERFVEVYEEVLPYLDLVDARSGESDGPLLTFFEVLVAMAYAAFADAPVEVGVIEVGMGGSWDATNVADGNVAVVMPIAIDHERFLGSDVATIAAEKAGIIKPGAVAVAAEQPEAAMRVLVAHADAVGARLIREGIDFSLVRREVAVGGQLLTISGLGGTYEDVFLPLHGAHQAHNAACALVAVEAFLAGARAGSREAVPALDGDVVGAGFAGVDSPGRLELVRRSPTILVDAAHNPAGAKVLAEAIEESFTFGRLVGVVGILADKDAVGILDALQPVLDEVVVTRSSSGRSMPVEDLAQLAEDVFGEERVHRASRLDEAIDVAAGFAERGGQIGGGVLVTGSITTVADARILLKARGS